jgi:hypothetical protein
MTGYCSLSADQHESVASASVSILGISNLFIFCWDRAEWDGFRLYDVPNARGSLLGIRSCSSTPSGEIACLQDVICLRGPHGGPILRISGSRSSDVT